MTDERILFMKKREGNETKRNHKGFSLVEVLVAIVVLAIISLPLLKAFSTPAVINARARKVENANTTAGKIMERFKTLTLEQLQEVYSGVCVDAEKGIYRFTVTDKDKAYYSGTNGEKYVVEVTLDPSLYRNDVDAEGVDRNNPENNINSYEMPKYTSLDKSKDFIIRDEIYKWDTDAEGTFRAQAAAFNQKNIKKSLVIDVSVEPAEAISADAVQAKFVQRVTGKIIYQYPGCVDISYDFSLENHEFQVNIKDNMYTLSKDTGIETVYLFYTPYDTNTGALVDGSSDAVYAQDEISIRYNYHKKTGILYDDLEVYLIEQKVMTPDHKRAVIDKRNLSLTVNNQNIEMQQYGTVDLSDNIGISGPVSLYSNITGFESMKKADSTAHNGITVNGESSRRDYLYEISIAVWENMKSKADGEEALVVVKSTKENES